MTETPTKAPVTQAELRRAQADTWVYFDGELRRYGDAHLGLLTHALHYGTGCFEGIRAYWSERQHRINVFRMSDHFARMTGNARMLHMQLPHSVEELCDITVELMRRNDFRTDVYIRPLVFKANEEIGIRFHNLRDGFMIVPVPFGAYVDTTGGIRCQVSSWRRIDDNVAPARSKATGIYINSALAKTEAFLNGFDEAILMTQDGHVCEGSAENLFIVRRGRLITPPASENIVEGITRAVLMAVRARRAGHRRRRARDRPQRALRRRRGAALRHRRRGVSGDRDRPAAHRHGEPGEVTRKLQDLYFGACKGEDDRFASWLTPIG